MVDPTVFQRADVRGLLAQALKERLASVQEFRKPA
jgi:hypothetical protein